MRLLQVSSFKGLENFGERILRDPPSLAHQLFFFLGSGTDAQERLRGRGMSRKGTPVSSTRVQPVIGRDRRRHLQRASHNYSSDDIGYSLQVETGMVMETTGE